MSIDRRRFALQVAAAGAAGLLGGCSAWWRKAPAAGAVPPAGRPPPESEEQALWAALDSAERALAGSRFVLRDETLTAYCHDVACRLEPGRCAELRAYVLRTPHVDASIAPNGMMQVSTGLLLRCRDEAQLAAIVGHALGHYVGGDTIARWRDSRPWFDLWSFFSTTYAVEGADAAGVLSAPAVAIAVAHTPEQERAADAFAIRLLARAGYAPSAAPGIWEQLLAEAVPVPDGRDGTPFFVTHPDVRERVPRMRELAAAAGGSRGELGRERYRTQLAPLLPLLLEDEIALRRYGRSLEVVDGLLDDAPDDGALWFAQGEIYRLRGADGDTGRALGAYARAIAVGGAPPQTWRSLGVVRLHAGARIEADDAFAEYLRRAPDAPDGAAVRALMTK